MAGKGLKYDVTLETGKFAQNMKNCVSNMKQAWANFGQSLKTDKSIIGTANALFKLGKDGSTAILTLIHPFQQVVKVVTALGVALWGTTKKFAELEKSALKASRAFRGHGLTNDGNKYYNQLYKTVTNNGTGDIASATGALADARRNAPFLSDEDLTFSIDISADMAAHNGNDYADSLREITTLLNKETVSYEDLLAAGISVSKEQRYEIEQLNGIANIQTRNIKLRKIMAETYKGAAQEEANTISGVYKRIRNMFQNLWVEVGEMLAPLAKTFFKLGQVIMNMAKGFIKPFVTFGLALGRIFEPIISGLESCAERATKFGTVLAFVATWLARGVIVQGIMAIVASLQAIISPFGLLAAAIGLCIVYWDEIVAGFKEGLGEERFEYLKETISDIGQQLMELGAQIVEWFGESGIMETVAEGVQYAFEMIGSVFGWCVDVFKWAQEKIMEFVKWVCGVVNKVRNIFGYDDLFDLSAFDTGGQPNKPKTPKKPDRNNPDEKGKKEPADPRLEFKATFESAASMNQRIQKSILSKSSPQVRMCDYLSEIKDAVKVLKLGQDKQTELVSKEANSAAETAKNTKGNAATVLG